MLFERRLGYFKIRIFNSTIISIDSGENILTCENLSASYPAREVLKDISFSITKGEWLGIIGPNGCGKTTLLKCLNKSMASKGEIVFQGKNLENYSIQELAKSMAYLRQAPNAGFSLTAREVASLGLLPHRGYLSRNSDDENSQIEDLFDDLGLMGMLDRKMESMSGGEQRMIFLAQVILQNPKLVLLDEPTVHLDPGKQFELLNKVDAMREMGLTVLSVFHDINLACRYVSRILVMEKGQLTDIGLAERVLKPSRIEQLFGVKAEIRNGADGKISVLMYS